MAEYDEDIKMATEEIDRFGRSIIVRRVVNIPIDQSDSGGGQTPTDNDMTTKGVFDPIDNKLVNGNLIKTGDMQCLISVNKLVDGVETPLERDIDVTDKIIDTTDNNKVWEIVRMTPTKPGEQLIMYDLMVRKGV